MTDAPLAHDEDGSLVPTEGFDYDTIERNLFGPEAAKDISELTPDQIDAALKLFSTLLQWVWQNGRKNPDGIQLRAMVVCWLFLKELRPLKLSELANGFGKKKQSLGRQVDDFKLQFPKIKSPHMRPTGD